ncbi:hypothetical protein H0H93_013157 [Arthromyces matolae]|nr:hypothetical protein H0H93_013157 [Arthromyces matolae]
MRRERDNRLDTKPTKKNSKKSSSDTRAPSPSPPKPPDPETYDEKALLNINLNEWNIENLIEDGIIGAAGQPAPRLDNRLDLQSSTSSAFEIDSVEDHSGVSSGLLPVPFNNPFPSGPTSNASKRTGRFYNRESRRISPKDRFLLEKELPASPADGAGLPGSLSWTAPESWGVEKNDLEAEYESSVDEDYGSVAAGQDGGRMSFAVPKIEAVDLDPSLLHDPLFDPLLRHLSSPPKKSKRKQGKRRITPYTVRIYKDDDHFHEATMALTTTVAELVPLLNEKLFIPAHETYRLYVRERGRERLLGMTEKPAALIKRRLEHHGYDANDGLILLKGDRLSFLIRFIYRSIIFTPDKPIIMNSFEKVDLEGRTLVAIPIAVHKNAEKVISLKLSGNPMLEIPLDFIQSCTSLRDLRLSNMSMKTVPKSVRHAVSISRLDLSSNRIGNLEEASLDRNVSLEYLLLQNNRLENLPWYFPRLRLLTVLNISNNKFRSVPPVVCQLESLGELDISFNMISELPEEIGKLVRLRRLIMVGNSISVFPDECANLVNLKRLDCRRNNITNLSVVTMLPELQDLFADHMPAVNARPDVFTYPLSPNDEFVIIADRSLWDFVSFQTAVDIARTERGDPMIAAQKLRDFAISYGAEGSTMIMVIGLTEPVDTGPKKKLQTLDRQLERLEGEVPAPVGHIALVFSDIRNSTHLWEVNPGMATAHKAHNALLRRLLRFCGGYEVKTEGDAFMCSFPTSMAAVRWCLRVQAELLEVAWPLEILECEDGKPIYDSSGNIIAKGLSVRMGIHCGTPSPEPDPVTHRMDYFGSMVNRSARICGNAAGGEIRCSEEILREIKASIYGEPETEYTKLQPQQAIDEIRQMGLHIVPVGEVKLKGLEVPENISVLYPSHLAGRQNWETEGITESGSRVPFSVDQMRELGLICLRLETLTTSRIFKVVPERKGSIQTLNLENDLAERSPSSRLKLYGDPNVLLPPMTAQSTDSELMILLDSLATRIVNAITTLGGNQTAEPQTSLTKYTIMSALEQRGELDGRTLERILSVLNSIQ